jgi:hypothetical protein
MKAKDENEIKEEARSRLYSAARNPDCVDGVTFCIFLYS